MYRAALIGLGNIAWKFGCDQQTGASLSHRDALLQHPSTELIAGFAPDQGEVDDFVQQTGVTGYVDLEEMLQRERPALVSICSPTEKHAEHLELCMRYQVPMVWLEKPAATSVDEVCRLEQYSRQMKKPTTVLVNFQRRYSEGYLKLRELLITGHFGKVLAVELHYSRGLVINGAHMLDILFFLFPDQPYELLWVEKGERLENPDFVLRLNPGVMVHVSGIDADFHNIDISIACERGRLSMLHGGMTARVEEVRENHLYPGYYRYYDSASALLGEAGFDRALDLALDDLITAYQSGTLPSSTLSTAIEGEALVETVMEQSQR